MGHQCTVHLCSTRVMCMVPLKRIDVCQWLYFIDFEMGLLLNIPKTVWWSYPNEGAINFPIRPFMPRSSKFMYILFLLQKRFLRMRDKDCWKGQGWAAQFHKPRKCNRAFRGEISDWQKFRGIAFWGIAFSKWFSGDERVCNLEISL